MLILNTRICFFNFRSDVPDEQILRWRFPDVRHRRGDVHGERPGGEDRPHDLHLPANDQVHFLQVRCLGRGGAPRRRLHPAAKRRQREDLHLPVVLVPNTGRPHVGRRHIQVSRRRVAVARVELSDLNWLKQCRQRLLYNYRCTMCVNT